MNCPKCNNDLPEDSGYCQYCGEKIAGRVDCADTCYGSSECCSDDNNDSDSDQLHNSLRASVKSDYREKGYIQTLNSNHREVSAQVEPNNEITAHKPSPKSSILNSKKSRIAGLVIVIAAVSAFSFAWMAGVVTTQHTEVFQDGSTYSGDWRYHKANGKGEMKYSDGRVFVGEWKNNIRDGQGVLTFSDGEKIEGQWTNDQRDGKQLYIKLTGETTESYARYDEVTGTMTITYSDGGVFKGRWKDDLKNGEGVYINKDGSQFVGVWKDGSLINGTGTFLGNDNSSYTGEWKDGKFVDGQGKYTSYKGNCYIGECKNGEPDGTGVLTYNDGRKYIGMWVNGTRYGRGTFIYPNGTVKKGEWSTEYIYLFITDSGEILDWKLTDM